MQTSRRVIVIHSPHSGRSEKLSQALELLQHSGIEVTDCISIADLDNLPPQGTNWMQRGIDVAIAAGGDGLVGGAITHIAESGLAWEYCRSVPPMILPAPCIFPRRSRWQFRPLPREKSKRLMSV